MKKVFVIFFVVAVFLLLLHNGEEETLRERAEVIKENDMVKERLTMNIFICSWTLLLKYF